MKTYEAIYYNGAGEVVYRVRFEVKNHKEASPVEKVESKSLQTIAILLWE